MDERKFSIPPGKLDLRSASARTSADIYPPSVEPDGLSSLERQIRCGQIEPSRGDFSDGSAVAVYYRSEQEVSRGFFIALSAMGVAAIEHSPEPASAAHAQEPNPVLNGGALSAEKSGSPKES